ncbi:primosomal protein N' [Anaerococcus sp. AGMB00486]|uniref:Replication restart protein PriA n=2 Tax=Anaerococcus TaxID=165779 RepID=A0ABX2N7C0_9FIRM|nr:MULTISPECIES: primosomal protein N' [Anaerococcus]MSS76932.1 primosomal protein N' [Anaerococcus porci]NVF10583.1 primosomal protein N' [Anaerococcus faecalis]
MYCYVILDSKSRFLDRSFTYHIPVKFKNSLKKGMRVIVPFGKANKRTIAFVYEIKKDIEEEIETKDIIEIIDSEAIINEELIDIAFFMHKRYLAPLRSCIKQVMPPGNIKEIREYFYKCNHKNSDKLLDFLDEKKSYEEIKEKFNINYDILESYKNDGLIKSKFELIGNQKINYIYYISLNKEVNYNIISKNAKKQKEILTYLEKNNITEYKKLLTTTKSSKSSLDSLIKKGLVKVLKKEKNESVENFMESYDKFKLNDEQEKAYKEVINNPNRPYLLKGVTGSGKTEVFLQIVEENLKNNKDAIILVPEISLTPQTIERFQGRFKQKIAVMHSKLTIKERFQQWRMIKNGEVKIVIGARSAIFAPFKNLGIIIIDEEHDKSYLSGKDPKYHTDEIALLRRKFHNASLIFASATPSLKTMLKAKSGEYGLLELKERINKTFPKIEIVDMRKELKNSNYSMISANLYGKIIDRLKKKEQIILFLNKVGHNSFTFCRSCGHVIKCEACDVAMTYHKHVSKLVCHYCGRTKNQPKICPSCGSKKIKEYGAGTEKLEEEVRDMFKGAKILRMDSITVKNRDSYLKMYKLMKENKVDILIGTQMIAKGLDFDNVTLVGVINADINLNVDDYTAFESSFQILTQVSGRAGRSNKNGEVVIQTYKPDNFVINTVSNNDYKTFYENEIAIRKAFSYPPFINLLTIKILNASRLKCIDISNRIKKYLDLEFSQNIYVEIIGPNPCKISRINNKYRYNIIIKCNDNNLNYLFDFLVRLRNHFINKSKDSSIIISLNPNDIN